MREQRQTHFPRYLWPLLVSILAIGTMGCVPGATGLFMSPPTAPVNHSEVHPTRVRKMGGDITIGAAPSGAELLTMGGNISVNRATGFVAATTMGGDIEIDTLEAGARVVTNGGNVRIFLVKTSSTEPRDVDITVRGGNLRLILEDPVSAQFDVQLGYTRDQAGRYSITSDFPLTQTTSEWRHGPGHLFQAHQHIDAAGTIGAGRDLIHVRVEGGMVYLSRPT